jgi:hypothetical protein
MLVKNSNNIEKLTMTSQLKSLNTKKPTTYDNGNADPGFGKVHKCSYVKPISGISTLSILKIGS